MSWIHVARYTSHITHHTSHVTPLRCTDGFTVRALLDDGSDDARATAAAHAQDQLVLLCHVDGFKYEYKVMAARARGVCVCHVTRWAVQVAGLAGLQFEE